MKRILIILMTVVFNLILIKSCISQEKKVDIDGRVSMYKAYKGFHYFLNESDNSIWRFDNNLKLINKIGKNGQGPGEFTSLSRFSFLQDKIYLYGNGKISIFDLNGELLQEIKSPFATVKCFLKNENAICKDREFNRSKSGKLSISQSIQYCDSNLKKISELVKVNIEITPGYRFEALEPYIDAEYSETKNLIYVSYPLKDLTILVFDEKGKKIGKIYKKYKPIKVNNDFKKEFLNTILQAPGVPGLKDKRIAEEVIKRTHFPKFFPPLHSFYIDENGDVFVKTFQRVKGKAIFEKYGMNVKFLRQYELPEDHIDIVDAKNFTAFSYGYYYYLYIDEEGNYILHKEKLSYH